MNMRNRVVTAVSTLVGGIAIPAIWDGQLALGSGLAVVTLAVIFQLDRVVEYLLHRLRTGYFAGLTVTLPVAPLQPGVAHDPAKVSRLAKKGAKILSRSLKRAPSIDLMLASGYRVIGWRHSPGWVFETLHTGRNRKLRVLLLDPDCPASAQRASRVMPGHGSSAYANGTRAVLSALRDLKAANPDLEVRLYDEAPIWQLAVTPSELWVMSAAESTPSDLSPMYQFKRASPYSLAWGLSAVWERRWQTATVVDLEEVSTPKPADVQSISR